ncbi:sensor histidine kinase [Microbispora sp. KK1-11]|uniref:sensor histidine kinase n=1 Tax=Microbispora sp. KK1-11 TaxID=2053005 RepID=UPI001C8EE23F|nr:histidine kinase [Microbispora sp. KK1-11]
MRPSRLLDLGLWLAVCAPPVAPALDDGDARRVATAAVAVPLFGVATAMSRRWPLAALAVPVAVSLALDAQMFGPLSWTWAALVVFGYLAGHRMATARPALWFFVAVALAGLPLSALVLRDLWDWPTQLITLLLAVVVPWLLGRWRRQHAELVRTGWLLADRLEREQRAVADRARLRERARIAGDMHDSLGHDLTLLAVRAGALELDPGLDSRQQASVRDLREAAAAATERLREIIGVLRTDDDESAAVPPREESIETLVERARDSGVPIVVEHPVDYWADHRADHPGDHRADHPGDIDGLPPMTALAVRRVLQEALTNAAKHAPGATVRVRFASDDGVVTLRVVNDAAPAAASPGVASGGSGLVGLAERVRLAGGVLRAGPAPGGGFEVAAELPVTGGRASEPDRREHAPTTPGLGAPETTSARELDLARRRVRRRLAQAVGIPAAVLTGIFALLIPLSFLSSSFSVLDPATYEGLKVGEPRDDVRSRLPAFTRDGPPDGTPDPPRGQDCAYYTMKTDSARAYRLCFAQDRLVSKVVVPTP